MNNKYLVFIIISLCFLTSCRKGYKVENNKVYYEYWNEGSGQNKTLLEKADAGSFKKLEFECNCEFEFGKDKNHLYIDGEPIRDIDPNTFKYIGNYVFRDKDSAYFFGFYDNINDCAIKGIDVNKIKLLKYPWSKSGNILINGYDTLLLDDIDDFVIIDKNWGRTKKHIINKDKILKGADLKTFEITDSYSGKDKNHEYEFGEIKQPEKITPNK
ncbi:hypothetical protein AR687_13110 [Flavobacteriaceae bacterium CRH]|nr:hypothetical protein AR687_13110 [Flavobacteriaceae bacterium CRH]